MRHYLTVKTGEIPNVRRGLRGIQGLRPHARGGRGRRRALGGGHPRLRRLLLRDGARPGAGQGARRRLPGPARTRRSTSPTPSCSSSTTTTRRHCSAGDDFAAGRAAGRDLRLPPRHLRHPDQLAEQDLRHLRPSRSRRTAIWRASRRTSCCCRPTGASRAMRSSTRDFTTRDLYNFRSRSYWLRRLENHGRKERVPVDEYTIEHILPQNENLSAGVAAGPRPRLGARPADVAAHPRQPDADRLQHRVQRRPFIEKRDMKGGFRRARCGSTRGSAQLDAWNETTITDARGASPTRRSPSGSRRHCPPTCSRPTRRAGARRPALHRR